MSVFTCADRNVHVGLRLTIRFTAPGHGGGCADVQGKCASHFLRQRANFQQKSAYNIWTAYERCKQGMKKPSKHKEQVKGTWGCNGQFFWRAYSNGKDKLGKDKESPSSLNGKETTLRVSPVLVTCMRFARCSFTAC